MIDIRNLPKENKPMNFKHLNKFSLVALIALASFSVRPAIGEEPLKTLPDIYAHEQICIDREPEVELKLQAVRIGEPRPVDGGLARGFHW